MDGRTKTLGGVLGATLLTIAALSTSSCEDTDDGGDGGMSSGSSLIDQIKQQCGLDCPDKGIVEGNASISGNAAIDQFFSSVVKFQTVSATVSAGIQAEVADIQAGFRVSPAELTAASGDVNAAIKAKVTAAIDGNVVVRAEPARCEIDAKATFEVKARCEASAGCQVQATPPMVNVQCQGSCEAEASVMASCTGGAKISCTVRDPSFMCTGQCNGQCTVSGSAAATCNGTCNGMCAGTCSSGDANNCAGRCNGTCNGTCTLDAQLTAQCSGSCSGECTYDPGSASCSANSTVRCEAQANASVMCQGRCDGQVIPPMVNAQCDAKASCEASAKADASLSVQCTPPTIEVSYKVKAGANAQVVADVRTGLNTLRAKLPSLRASMKKADVVTKAGVSLTADAQSAVMASVDALRNANVDIVAKYRIAACVPREVPRVGTAIKDSSDKLNAQLNAATTFQTMLGVM